MKSSTNPMVVEIGGGGGIDFFALRAILEVEPCVWVNIETQKMVDACGETLRKYPNLRIVTQDNYKQYIRPKFDLLYTNSALQYLGNQINMLEDLLRYQPREVVIARTPYIKESIESVIKVSQWSRYSDNGPSAISIKSQNYFVEYQSNLISIHRVSQLLKNYGYEIWKVSEKEYWEKKPKELEEFEIAVFDIFAKHT